MQEKKFRTYQFIKLVVYLAVLLGLLFCMGIFTEYLDNFIGSIMLLYGVEEIIFISIFERKDFLKQSKLYFGCIEIMLGLVLLFSQASLESTCVVWATWSIIRESYEIKEILTDLKCLTPKIISGVESIAAIVLSISLILNPNEHHAMIHFCLLFLELPLTPLVPLLDEYISDWKKKKAEKENKSEAE